MEELLSASRISCVMRCPREYACRYILKIAETKTKSLLMGKAFARLLEGQKANFDDLNAMHPDYPWGSALKVMYAGYLNEITKYGQSVGHEIDVRTTWCRMVVDSVRVHDGKWWITENKTCSLEPKWDTLHLDNQLNVYVRHSDEIAEATWQDPAAFGGVIYTATLKPRERRKKAETVEQFGDRMTSSTLVRVLPKEIFKPSSFEALAQYAVYRIDEIEAEMREGNLDNVPPVVSQCTRFGSQCPFFSTCHGEGQTDESSEC